LITIELIIEIEIINKCFIITPSLGASHPPYVSSSYATL